jgi:hypothetical protein
MRASVISLRAAPHRRVGHQLEAARPMPERRRDNPEKPDIEKQRAARKAAKRDPHLREQVKTETEERPYLDTEGGE